MVRVFIPIASLSVYLSFFSALLLPFYPCNSMTTSSPNVCGNSEASLNENPQSMGPQITAARKVWDGKSA